VIRSIIGVDAIPGVNEEQVELDRDLGMSEQVGKGEGDGVAAELAEELPSPGRRGTDFVGRPFGSDP
jgi:hypothetical protein